MTPTLLLALVMTAAPCTRVVVTPFEPVAITPVEARKLEEQVRRALANRPGLCVEPRGATIEKLAKYPRHALPPCVDRVCVTGQLAALDADELLSGVVVGAGGHSNLDLVRNTGVRTARTTASASELEAAMGVLYQWDTKAPAHKTRWPSIALGVAAVTSAGVGVGLGVDARRREQLLSSGNTGCGGNGTAYRDCLDAHLKTGKGEATAANVLFGVAGALLTGAVVLWVVELP